MKATGATRDDSRFCSSTNHVWLTVSPFSNTPVALIIIQQNCGCNHIGSNFSHKRQCSEHNDGETFGVVAGRGYLYRKRRICRCEQWIK